MTNLYEMNSTIFVANEYLQITSFSCCAVLKIQFFVKIKLSRFVIVFNTIKNHVKTFDLG